MMIPLLESLHLFQFNEKMKQKRDMHLFSISLLLSCSKPKASLLYSSFSTFLSYVSLFKRVSHMLGSPLKMWPPFSVSSSPERIFFFFFYFRLWRNFFSTSTFFWSESFGAKESNPKSSSSSKFFWSQNWWWRLKWETLRTKLRNKIDSKVRTYALKLVISLFFFHA